MVAYTKPQQRKKEESKRLRGERDEINSWKVHDNDISVKKATGSHPIKSALVEKSRLSSPGFCYTQIRVCRAFCIL